MHAFNHRFATLLLIPLLVAHYLAARDQVKEKRAAAAVGGTNARLGAEPAAAESGGE